MTEGVQWPVLRDWSLPFFLLLALLSGPKIQAADWPARNFEVVVAEPGMRELMHLDPIDAGLYELDGGVPKGRPLDPQLGKWLTEIGNIYLSAGHLEPKLEPIVEIGDTPTYRTFMFPYKGSALISKGPNATAGYMNTCGDERLIGWGNIVPWLSINQKTVAVTGISEQRYLGSLSHEMMHALVSGDRLGKDCQGTAFTVTEGIPNGATMYIYKLKFPGYTGRVSRSRSAVGLRSYALSLTYGD